PMNNASRNLKILFFIGFAFFSFGIDAQTESIEKNKKVVDYLYDSIAHKAFNVLLNDDERVTLKDNFNTHNLKLIEIRDSLKKIDPKALGVKYASGYADRLLVEKNSLLNVNGNFQSKDSFNEALDKVISSDKVFASNI